MVKGLAHITGGGITENLPRMLPDTLKPVRDGDAVETPAVFKWLQLVGNVEDSEMLRTFNMGVGMVLAVAPEKTAAVLSALKEAGEDAFLYGHLENV